MLAMKTAIEPTNKPKTTATDKLQLKPTTTQLSTATMLTTNTTTSIHDKLKKATQLPPTAVNMTTGNLENGNKEAHRCHDSKQYKRQRTLTPEPMDVAEVVGSFQRKLQLVEDIDEGDDGNPQLCSEYVMDIYQYLRELEV